MKKLLSLILALILTLSLCAVAFADDPNEVTGTVEMPLAGLRFVPPEQYRDVKGQVITDGAIQLADGIYYAYWLYGAMTEDELIALYDNTANVDVAPLIELFYVFSIGGGYTFDDMNNMIGNTLDAAYAHEIGHIGDYRFYLYMDSPNQSFVDFIDAEYKDEYKAIAGAVDDFAAAFTCYEPLDPQAALAGSVISFTTKDLDGNTVSSEDLFAQNEITMINVWATWCGPCVGELAELQEIYTRLQEKGCGIIGLLDDTDLKEARNLVAQNGITYPIIIAPDNYTYYLPIKGYPSSFFVNRNGEIIGEPIAGAYPDQYEPAFESLLQNQN